MGIGNPDTKMAQRACNYCSSKNNKGNNGEIRPNTHAVKPTSKMLKCAPYSEVVTIRNKMDQTNYAHQGSTLGCGVLFATSVVLALLLSKTRQRT